MREISIIFSRSSKPLALFSWLIMATEGTSYSHVALKTQDQETGETLYYQASHTMVNVMSESVFLGQEKIIDQFDFQVSDALFQKVIKAAENKLGIKYGVLSAVGLGIIQIAKWFKLSLHNPFKEVGQEYVCSQFVGALIEAGEQPIPVPLDDLTPVLLHPVVKNLPKTWI